jgi:outer membrane biosynthesis protein TonB
MSLLQRKNIHKRHLLWVKLFGICLFFHLIFLFWIFCIYQDNSYMLSLSVHKRLDYSSPIMFVFNSAQADPTEKNNIESKQKIVATPPKPKSTPQNNKATPPSVKKPVTVATTIPKKTNTPNPTINTAIAVADASFDKLPPTHKASSDTQRTSGEEKLETKKEDIQPKADVKKTTSPIAQALDDTHVSNNYREVEALRMQAQLQKEIVQKWKPPIGVSPDCTCDVSFFVNTNGGVENIKMAKNSGVMMFDISARQALCAIKMPHWTHGKTLTITFKQ